jgi:peptidylprolyl isomerase
VSQHTKWIRWLLAATISLMILSLAACQPKENKTAVSDSQSTTSAPNTTPGDTTTVATQVPYVLPGAVTTDSGLQFLELTAGDGPSPQEGNVITMNYIASLPDGTEIYNTYTQNQPSTAIFGRNQLLPGWEEGVGMMKAGGKAKFVMPPELAFGDQGAGMVPPNSQIVMEVELLSVKPAPTHASVATDQLQKMDNGVLYYDLIQGDGMEAITNTTVTTQFAIWVAGSTSDDFIISSEDDQPVTFVVGRGDMVFPGWEQGVIGMKVGGKRLLRISPELALGAQGSGPIPANATLIMEITLTDVHESIKATQVDENDYVTMPSGLKYYDIQVGRGVTPTIGQTVVVNYVGWLEDGTQFDSSYDRGQPFSFQIGMGKVIAGWDLGLATMKVGGKRQLVIPADLAYGDTGSGSTIPPGATLVFEVELLEIKP